MEVKQLYIYPIKSLLPIPLTSATLGKHGFKYDREFLLIRLLPDDKFEHLTIKTVGKLCLLQPTLDPSGESFTVHHVKNPSNISPSIPLPPPESFLSTTKVYPIQIFDGAGTGHDMGDEYADFFSTALGETNLRFVYIGVSRAVHPALTPPNHPQSTAFADAAPLLLTTTASLNEVSGRLGEGEEMDITKFRPNIHISVPASTEPYDEEMWAEVEIGGLLMDCTFNTPRCQSLNVDYETGDYKTGEKMVLKKIMTKDRRVNPMFKFKGCFGRYACCRELGATVRIGDAVVVRKWKKERTVEEFPGAVAAAS